MPKPTHQPTEKTRAQVQALAIAGTNHELIGEIIGLRKQALYKHYRDELDYGVSKANARVVQGLFKNAIEGNVTAQIFWCKTKLKWRETDRLELTGAGGGGIEIVVNVAQKTLKPEIEHKPKKKKKKLTKK